MIGGFRRLGVENCGSLHRERLHRPLLYPLSYGGREHVAPGIVGADFRGLVAQARPRTAGRAGRGSRLAESQGSRDSLLASQPLQFPLQSLRRVPFRSKPAALNSLRVSTAHPVPVRPRRLPVTTCSLQPDQLGPAATSPITPFAWRYGVIVMSTWVSRIGTSERTLECLYD
jgi:hypothetical protein